LADLQQKDLQGWNENVKPWRQGYTYLPLAAFPILWVTFSSFKRNRNGIFHHNDPAKDGIRPY
jgi:hypothetical protein